MWILTIVPSALQSCLCVAEPFGFEAHKQDLEDCRVWIEQGDLCAGAVRTVLPTPSRPRGQGQAQICAQGRVWQLMDTSLLLRAVISLSFGLPAVWEWDSLSALWALGPHGVRGG